MPGHERQKAKSVYITDKGTARNIIPSHGN